MERTGRDTLRRTLEEEKKGGKQVWERIRMRERDEEKERIFRIYFSALPLSPHLL